jgi:MerR family transcriptional regulator, light-induced transcriptional regulator
MSADRDANQGRIFPGLDEVLPAGLKSSHRFKSRSFGRADSQDIRGALSEAIRSIVLPRLVAARRANDMALALDGSAVTERDVAALLSHVATADHNLAEAMLTVLALRGVSRADVLLELFQPVARRLGESWLDDDCTFADVTLGVGRLQRLMRSDAMPTPPRIAAAGGGRILVACLPGEQHTLGAAIVEDFFRSAGWDTVSWSGKDEATLEVVARAAPFDLIAISISDPHAVVDLAPIAGRLRRASSRSLAGILAGGRGVERGATAAELGVDAVVHDARAAVPAARSLLRTG